MNGGGIRASIQAPAGTAYPYSITQNDVLTVLPVRGHRRIHRKLTLRVVNGRWPLVWSRASTVV